MCKDLFEQEGKHKCKATDSSAGAQEDCRVMHLSVGHNRC